MPSKKQKQLRKDIAELTKELNRDLSDYYLTNQKVDIFEHAISKTIEKAHAKQLNSRGELPKGWNLNKISDLENYKRELTRLKNFDMFTPTAIQRQEYLKTKAYNTFKRRHKSDMTYEEYSELAEVFRTVSDDIVEQLTSDQIVEIYSKAREKNMSTESLAELIANKYDRGARMHLDSSAVSLSILNSIKYGRYNRGK